MAVRNRFVAPTQKQHRESWAVIWSAFSVFVFPCLILLSTAFSTSAIEPAAAIVSQPTNNVSNLENSDSVTSTVSDGTRLDTPLETLTESSLAENKTEQIKKPEPEPMLNVDQIADENNLLIVNLKREQLKFNDDLFIFHYEGISLIPLQPLFDQLDFAITVDPEQKFAQGWFLTEQNNFRLQGSFAYLNNKLINNPPNCFFYSDDFDYYVSINCINEWFGLGLVLKVQRLELRITSKQTLPFMARMERSKKQGKIRQKLESEQLDLIQDQYQLYGLPVVDFNMGYMQTNDTDSIQATALSAFDTLGLETRLNLSKQQDKTVGSLAFHRAFKHPDDLSILGMNKISAGDIYGVSDDLTFSGGSGVGIQIESAASSNAGNFTRRTIEGISTPGWEVELYRNGALIEFTEVTSDGRYRFEDVDVEYGKNIFDIKLYGPQGQLRTERESILIGSNRLKPNETTWNLNLLNKNQSLIDDREANSNLDQSQISQLYVQRGITDQIGIGLKTSYRQDEELSQFSQKVGDTQTNYQSITLFSSLPGVNLSLEQSFSSHDGLASGFNIQGNLFDYSSTLQIKQFNDYESERINGGNGARTKFFSAGNFSIFDENINHTVRYDLINQPNQHTHDFNNQFGFQTDYGLLTAKNKFLTQRGLPNTVTGELNFNSFSGQQFRYKFGSAYEINPDTRFRFISGQLSFKQDSKIQYNFDTNIDLLENDNTSFNLSANYRHQTFTTNPQLSYKLSGDYSISLNFEMSISPYQKNYFLSKKQEAYGQLQIRTFLDKDSNGRFNEGDEALEGLRFKGLKEWEYLETDSDGLVTLTGLSPTHPNRIQIIEATIGDPFWKPLKTEFHILSHAGGFQTISYPIFETLEVEGSVMLSRNNKERAGSGIPFQLRDLQGKVVATTISEFDGVFVFAGVPKGKLELHIEEDFIVSRKIKFWEPKIIDTSQEEGVYYMDSFILFRD